VKVLVHKLHVDRCEWKLLSKGDYAYHVPLKNAPISDLIVVFAITDKWILRVDVNNLIGSAFTFYSTFFGLNWFLAFLTLDLSQALSGNCITSRNFPFINGFRLRMRRFKIGIDCRLLLFFWVIL
jgi:hypothetical protein